MAYASPLIAAGLTRRTAYAAIAGCVAGGLAGVLAAWSIATPSWGVAPAAGFVIGLLGEMQIRTYYEAQNKPIYIVRETLGWDAD